MPEVRLMVSRHSAFYSPLIATIAGGFLEKEGLSGTYAVVPSGSGTPAEVGAGRVDVGQAAVASSWGAAGPGRGAARGALRADQPL